MVNRDPVALYITESSNALSAHQKLSTFTILHICRSFSNELCHDVVYLFLHIFSLVNSLSHLDVNFVIQD